jgi:hypothetical protein
MVISRAARGEVLMDVCLRKSLEANFISESDNKGTHLRSFHLYRRDPPVPEFDRQKRSLDQVTNHNISIRQQEASTTY